MSTSFSPRRSKLNCGWVRLRTRVKTQRKQGACGQHWVWYLRLLVFSVPSWQHGFGTTVMSRTPLPAAPSNGPERRPSTVPNPQKVSLTGSCKGLKRTQAGWFDIMSCLISRPELMSAEPVTKVIGAWLQRQNHGLTFET